MLDGLINYLIDFVNVIVKGIASSIVFILKLLPSSPFEKLDNSPIASYLPSLNWVFPINEVIAILESWLIAIALYYVISVALRWAKVIE